MFVVYKCLLAPFLFTCSFMMSRAVTSSVALRGRFIWPGFYSVATWYRFRPVLGLLRVLHQLLEAERQVAYTVMNNKVGGRQTWSILDTAVAGWWGVEKS